MSDLPEEFINRLKEQFPSEAEAALNSISEGREYHALRFRASSAYGGFPERKDLGDIVGITGIEEEVPFCEGAYYYDADEHFPGKHPLHEAGAYYIQEPSAMLPVSLLHPEPGERILDLCAAPGGKSTQIGTLLQGEGLLVSNEPHPERCRILSSNIERLGIKNAVVLNETPERLSKVFSAYFDKILVDAPCSGEGMFRKNPEAVNEWSHENVLMCAERQKTILEEAVKMLRPGGKLVYSTCTFSKEENEDQIESFVSAHPDVVRGAEDSQSMFRIWPHRFKGEGHFAAVLERAGDVDRALAVSDKTERAKKKKSGRSYGAVNKDMIRAFTDCCEDFINADVLQEMVDRLDSDRAVLFKDDLFILPEGFDRLLISSLKWQRPGLHLGRFITSGRGTVRFEPSHSLALSLDIKDISDPVVIPPDDERAVSYIHGESLPIGDDEDADEKKGGYRILCFGIYPAGFVKKAGNTYKNHYPKGLRR